MVKPHIISILIFASHTLIYQLSTIIIVFELGIKPQKRKSHFLKVLMLIYRQKLVLSYLNALNPHPSWTWFFIFV